MTAGFRLLENLLINPMINKMTRVLRILSHQANYLKFDSSVSSIPGLKSVEPAELARVALPKDSS